MKRVPPSVRMKEEVEELLRGEAVEQAPAETPRRGFVRSLARYILQVSIEEEATTFLGRKHYRRGGRLRVSWGNGYSCDLGLENWDLTRYAGSVRKRTHKKCQLPLP